MDKLELQKLRDLPIEGVAERLGLSVVRHKCLCPFHDDHHASLSFSVSRNTYRCFVCGATGGTIDLVMQHLHLDFKQACRWLASEHNIILNQPEPINQPATTNPAPSTMNHSSSTANHFDASRYERYFEHPQLTEPARRFLFTERMLDERVVRWCRLTSWADRNGVSWLQIPYYDRDGRLVGVQNRNLGKRPTAGDQSRNPAAKDLGGMPRFRFPSGSRCGIYNLPVLNMLQPGDELYITEGCSDCWAMLSSGHKAIAIPSATLLTPADVEQLSLLSDKLGGKVGQSTSLSFHMYPDRDAPGERLFMQLRQILPGLEHHQLPQGCKDYSEYYMLTKGASLRSRQSVSALPQENFYAPVG